MRAERDQADLNVTRSSHPARRNVLPAPGRWMGRMAFVRLPLGRATPDGWGRSAGSPDPHHPPRAVKTQ